MPDWENSTFYASLTMLKYRLLLQFRATMPSDLSADSQLNTVLAILQAAIAMAGLLLVFVGFVYAKAGDYDSRRGDKFRLAAKLGIVPFLLATISAAVCCAWLIGMHASLRLAILSITGALLATGIYGVVVLIFLL
jgi:hypothetical protein